MDLIMSCKRLFKGRNSCSCSFMLYLSKDFITSREAKRDFFVKYDKPYVSNLELSFHIYILFYLYNYDDKDLAFTSVDCKTDSLSIFLDCDASAICLDIHGIC